MRTCVLLFAGMLWSGHSLAHDHTFVVEEEKATKLIEVLEQAPMTAHEKEGQRLYSVSNISCTYTPYAFVWAQCQMRDDHAGADTPLLAGIAYSFYQALSAAGVEIKAVSPYEELISAAGLTCTKEHFSETSAKSRCIVTLY